ncbi:nuclear transport factor 2 family protein [Modestobacter marinus]|uniref:nuclear transport factor 2 family protein n=1 Tax=Modestobacter marinus TaxID=477641 RepID=UPI001C94E678|nr:nuclear transport factor 2 family protein [Modestobacter marinus]
MPTPRAVAEAFSGHRFPDAYGSLHPDVRWTQVGQEVLTGRQAVVDACEATLAELVTTTVEFSRFLVVADENAAAVDVVGRYVDADGATSVGCSCDVYEFRDGMVTAITSYAVELYLPALD